MLALADKNGIVETSIPGLADASRVTVDECYEALQRLQAPDQYSRSQEHEGRRIEEVEGGFLLLNYVKYRGQLTREKIRAQTRARVRKYREKKKKEGCNVDVTHNAQVTPSNAQSESESESYKNIKKNIKKKAQPLDSEWEPNEKHHTLAHDLGVNVEWEADQMRDWAEAKGETKKNWNAAFNNWIRRAAKNPPQAETSLPPPDEEYENAMEDFEFK